MISETLADGLAQYRIGDKVRSLRQQKKLGLVQLGEHTGLSTAMLSKIERGQLFPTLPTLMRIALAFGVGLEHFFTDNDERPLVAVIRKKDRLRLPDRRDGKPPSYFFESLDFPVTNRRIESYFAEFPANSAPSEPHRHDGVELVFVLKGRLSIDVDGGDRLLEEGDAMYFDSGIPHSYCQQGRSACSAIIVVAPESRDS